MKHIFIEPILKTPVLNSSLMGSEDNIGSELLENSDFNASDSWSLGTGWSIAAGVASKAAGNATHLVQSGKLTLGKVYRITFDIVTADSEGFAVRAGNGNPTSPRYGIGKHTVEQTCLGNTTFYIYATATVVGSIASVSCKEINPD